ncbi:hypothetical protein DHD05_22420 [Arenibacter sp. N53]|nr:hypothetical protein [Arenibacter sp. N53]
MLKKIQINSNSTLGSKTSHSFVTTGTDCFSELDTSHLSLHMTNNQKVVPFKLEYSHKLLKKILFQPL